MAKDEQVPENVDLDSEGIPPLEPEKELADDEVYPAAEEAAVHILEEPPGAVDRNVHSYTGRKSLEAG